MMLTPVLRRCRHFSTGRLEQQVLPRGVAWRTCGVRELESVGKTCPTKALLSGLPRQLPLQVPRPSLSSTGSSSSSSSSSSCPRACRSYASQHWGQDAAATKATKAAEAAKRGFRSTRTVEVRSAVMSWLREGPLGRAVWKYRDLNKAYPLRMSFMFCFLKGILADLLAQKVIEGRETVEKRRTLAIALFSGTFCGCVYYWIFNVAFERVFAPLAGLTTVLPRVATDAVFVFPFMYMPTFYFFDEIVRFGTLTNLTTRWTDEICSSIPEYVKVWPAANMISFLFVPVELRITFASGVSFLWLILLSFISH